MPFHRYCPACSGPLPPHRVAADTIIEVERDVPAGREDAGQAAGRRGAPARRPGGIVVIERRNPPPGFALPGGFWDPGESLEECAVREAREETCLAVTLCGLLGVYSRPGRDPRGATVTAVYVARAEGTPRAADDARAVHIVDPWAPPHPLAFDHEEILGDYRAWLRGERALGAV